MFCGKGFTSVTINDRYNAVQTEAEQLIVLQITRSGNPRPLASILASAFGDKWNIGRSEKWVSSPVWLSAKPVSFEQQWSKYSMRRQIPRPLWRGGGGVYAGDWPRRNVKNYRRLAQIWYCFLLDKTDTEVMLAGLNTNVKNSDDWQTVSIKKVSTHNVAHVIQMATHPTQTIKYISASFMR
jgi:hypothetical protein